MRPIGWRWLAVSSLLLGGWASAATRPHYGGGLRVNMLVAPVSLDPADGGAAAVLTHLIFDTLVTLDSRATAQAALAISWQADPNHQRWQFNLRPGVRFQDGSALTSDAVAASLRTANPDWKVLPLGDAVVIERDAPSPDLPAELALPRNAIVKRDGKLVGTGPFAVTEWAPGKKLTLLAQDDYWGGRVFADSVQIELGKNLREQMLALDLGKSDVIEVGAEQAHRAAAEGRNISRSAPAELIALVFAADRRSPEEGKLRQALALSIDRQTIKNVLLQGEGVPTGAILPNWMSGYGFLFPPDADLARARQARNEVRQAPAWTLGYDANDPLARLIAERVVLNARDAGLVLQVSGAANADLRVVRIPLSSLDSQVALAGVAARLGLTPAKRLKNSVEDLYAAEAAMLESQRVIPLLHLPVNHGLSNSVRNWNQDNLGVWHLEDVWVSSDKP